MERELLIPSDLAQPQPSEPFEGGGSRGRLGASTDVAASGQINAWRQRAEWLEREAASRKQPPARARLLLAASEARAILGELRAAHRLAQDAEQLGDPAERETYSRQARAFAEGTGDYGAAITRARKEAAAARTPAARAHAWYMAGELCRLGLRDNQAASQCLDSAHALVPDDVRIALSRTLSPVSAEQEPAVRNGQPARKSPRSMEASHPQLAAAAAGVAALESGIAPKGHSELTLLTAAEQLRAGEATAAGRTLCHLCADSSLEAGARLLDALWQRDLRAEAGDLAVKAMQRVVALRPGPLERRLLAALALRSRDGKALVQALQEGGSPPVAGPPAFSTLDRASCFALLGGEDTAQAPEDFEPEWVSQLLPLWQAQGRPIPSEVAQPTSRAATLYALGWQLHRAGKGSDALERAGSLQEGTPWGVAWRLERHREQLDFAALAADLEGLFPGQKAAQADCHCLAGILLERQGEFDEARKHYRAALLSRTARETAVRALMGDLGAAEQVHLLRSLSVQTTGRRRALLLTEALFRLDPLAGEYDALAEEAMRCDPELGFSALLAERGAFQRRDELRVSRWLQQRRQQASEGEEALVEGVREALALAQRGNRLGVQRLSDVARSAPSDLAVWRLLESLTHLPPEQRAAWRVRVAEHCHPRLREHLLADATHFFVEVGDLKGAQQAAESIRSPWGELQRQRLDRTPDDRARLELASQVAKPAERAAVLERQAALERKLDCPQQAVEYDLALLELEPRNLPAAYRVWQSTAHDLKQEAFLRAAEGLLGALPHADALPYAVAVSRTRQASGVAGLTPAQAERIAKPGEELPLWALRMLQDYGARTADDGALLLALRALLQAPLSDLDQTTLCLRGAECAMRLRDWDTARNMVNRATQLAPTNLVGLSLRAEVLDAQADFVGAADAYEALASNAHSAQRQVEALNSAAAIWRERLGDDERSLLPLERAEKLAPDSEAIFQSLLESYQRLQAHERIYELVSKRKERTSSETERRRLELAKAEALRAAGRPTAARAVLVHVLEAGEEQPRAEHVLAQCYADEGALELAESTWNALLDSAPPKDVSLMALRSLSDLYHRQDDDPAKGAQVCQLIVEVEPDDQETIQRLIVYYSRLGRYAEAVQLQANLWERASGDEERRRLTLEWVRLLTHLSDGQERAKQLLAHARKTWPASTDLLRAEISFYRERGDDKGAHDVAVLAVTRSREAVRAGRLEVGRLRVLEVAARAAGELQTARMAQAVLGALQGTPLDLQGTGLSESFFAQREMLAPEPLGGPVGRLLQRYGDTIEVAYADTQVCPPTEPLDRERSAQVKAIAENFGVQELTVLVSSELGCQCIPLRRPGPAIVFGAALLDYPNPRVRDFLLLRALSTLQLNLCALCALPEHRARMAIVGLSELLGANLESHQVDPSQLAEAQGRLDKALAGKAPLAPDPQLAQVAAEQLRGSVEQIGQACLDWALNASLLGVGEPLVALESLWAETHGRTPMPAGGEPRLRWAEGRTDVVRLLSQALGERHAEARAAAAL